MIQKTAMHNKNTVDNINQGVNRPTRTAVAQVNGLKLISNTSVCYL